MSHPTTVLRRRRPARPPLVLAALVAALPWLAPAPVLAQTAAAPAAAPAPTPVRTDVAKAVNAAADLANAGKAAEALPALEQAIATLGAATPPLTPAEASLLQRVRGGVAMGAGNLPTAAAAMEAALAAGGLAPVDQLLMLDGLAGVHFQLKNYPAARDWARRAVAAGSTRPDTSAVLINALLQTGEYEPAARELQARIGRATAAGQVPGETDLRLLASAQAQLRDEAGYLATLELLMRHYPRPEYWPDAIARVQRQPGFAGEKLALDLQRLRRQLKLVSEADDFLYAADLAQRAGQPVEAKATLDAGAAAGVLPGTGATATDYKRLRETIDRQAAQDRAALNAANAPAPATPNAAISTGLALAAMGQVDKAVATMQGALDKPGLRDPHQARLQLGVVLAQAGRRDDAATVLRQVQGGDGTASLARLWLLAIGAAPK